MQQGLMRINNTIQVGADEKTRKKQALRAYKEREIDASRRYVLLDDV